MTISAAHRIAHQWAYCFTVTFFVIEIGPDNYGVTSFPGHEDRIVARIEA